MNKNYKVLIIGAGPTGLTAALHFAKKGIIPTIVEKRKDSSTWSRAIGIMPESLERLGKNISAKILQESMPFMKINMHVDNQHLLKLNFQGKVKETEVLTGLPQDRTEEIIKVKLETLGVHVNYATEVTDIRTTEDYAEVSFNSKEERRRYDWVVA